MNILQDFLEGYIKNNYVRISTEGDEIDLNDDPSYAEDTAFDIMAELTEKLADDYLKGDPYYRQK